LTVTSFSADSRLPELRLFYAKEISMSDLVNQKVAASNNLPPSEPIQKHLGVSADVSAMMAYDNNKKSLLLSYLLWLFLGGFGAHRFYNGQTGTGVAQLLLLVFGFITTVFFIGFFLLGALFLWVLIDAFLIPNWVRNNNNLLINQLR
jgi:TM2 domain-containing membrane protein YozV